MVFLSRKSQLGALTALKHALNGRDHRTQDDVSQDAIVDPMAGEAEDQAKLVDGHASMCPADRP